MTTFSNNARKIGAAAAGFLMSTVITWWFISEGSALYHFDQQKMFLSCAIAGGNWGVQIIAALLFLKEQRWVFIRNIAFTCLAGSCLLIPFCFSGLRSMMPASGFFLSLVASVAAMLLLYYYSVRRSKASVKWYFLWLACLAIAVSLQLTIVFHVL